MTLLDVLNRRSSLVLVLGAALAVTPSYAADVTEPAAPLPPSASLPDAPGVLPESAAALPPAPAALPDAPSALLDQPAGYSSSAAETSEMNEDNGQATPAAKEVRPWVKFVPAGRIAPTQTAGDKVKLSLRESVTPFSAIAWVTGAGWSHLIDSAPHYGTNSEAFAQRFGASVVNSVSKEIFTDGLYAPLFHQDPRYYQLGRSHKFFNRAVYAGTRPFIGKSDSGKTIPNYASILGSGSAASLAMLYYPDRDQTGSQVMWNWASALGGTALGNVVSELGGEVLQWLHLPKVMQ